MYAVKSLRLGNFGAVLEMLGDIPDSVALSTAQNTTAPGWHGSSQMQYAFDKLPENLSYISPDRLSSIYGDVPSTQPETPRCEKRKEPPRPKLSEAEAVARELRLHQARTLGDLRRIRRKFALRNHPDRVPQINREEATRRMTIANALIDGAMQNLTRFGRT